MLTLDERKLIDSYCMMNEPINIVENKIITPIESNITWWMLGQDLPCVKMYPITIKDVMLLGENNYRNMLSILRYNKNCIEDSKELKRIENIGFVNFMYSKFDMSFRYNFMQSLSIFFKNKNIVSNVDDKTNNLYFDIIFDDFTFRVDENNYDYIRNIMLYMCCDRDFTKEDLKVTVDKNEEKLKRMKNKSRFKNLLAVKNRNKNKKLDLEAISSSWLSIYINTVNWDNFINYNDKQNMTLKQLYMSYQYLSFKEDDSFVRNIVSSGMVDTKKNKFDLSFVNDKFNKKVLIPLYKE